MKAVSVSMSNAPKFTSLDNHFIDVIWTTSSQNPSTKRHVWYADISEPKKRPIKIYGHRNYKKVSEINSYSGARIVRS